jgi:hypothetical protein
VYVLKVALRESSLSAWMFLTHKERFTEEQWKVKVEEAVKITNDVRPLRRRQHYVDSGQPIPTPIDQYNQDMFEADANYLECVFADKWGFKKLMHMGTDATLECTILGQGDRAAK